MPFYGPDDIYKPNRVQIGAKVQKLCVDSLKTTTQNKQKQQQQQ